MRRFTAVCILCVGLIATCTARNIFVENNQLDGSSSSEESTESKDFASQIQTACYENTGSNQTFEAVIDSVGAVPICFLMNMDVLDFTDDLDRLNASTRHEFFPKLILPTDAQCTYCFDPPIKQISKCMDEDDALIVVTMHNALPDVLDMICKNDGKILFLENANYDVCMNNYSNYTEECASVVSNSTNVMEFSKYGAAQCGELAKVRDCMQGKFNECDGPRIMEVFDVFYRALIKTGPCENFITGQNEVEDDKALYETV